MIQINYKFIKNLSSLEMMQSKKYINIYTIYVYIY